MTPNDPFFARQSHFDLIGDVRTIWDEYTGAGVYVGVYDDGVDFTHPDLRDRYDPRGNIVIDGQTRDGAPNDASAEDQSHGTAVAGLIAASGNNGAGVVGVAWGASLAGVNVFDTTKPEYIESEDFTAYIQALHQMMNFDIVNCSYSHPFQYDSANSAFTPGSMVYAALQEYRYASGQGREGLGTIIVKSAANAGRDSNGVSESASRYTVTVAATREDGFAAGYSNYGAGILVTAPGSEAPGSIVTTDRPGTKGYTAQTGGDGFDGTGNYTSEFGGTSAAAPIVSGVVALMLEANADLGWRDVQNILAYSAAHTGSAIGTSAPGPNENGLWRFNGADDWNGGGAHFSVDYGYGMVDAFAAVRMAEAWGIVSPVPRVSANELSVDTGTIRIGGGIPDKGGLQRQITISDTVRVEHVDLTLDIKHSYFGDLRVYLISPDGTRYDATCTGDRADNGLVWSWGFDGFRGELSSGTWTVGVDDIKTGDTGVLNALRIEVFGAAPSADDVYHYTAEFGDTLALAGQDGRRVLSDTDGGVDWIEAAAVRTNTIVDLTSGTATVDGVALTVSGVEHVVAGDGADSLTGNRDDNKLFGMRGNDTLNGGAGTDELHGGAGDDTLKATLLDGSTAGEVYDGGADTDTLRLGNDVADGSYFFDLRDDTLTAIERLAIQSPGSGNTAYVALLAGQIGSGLSSYAEIAGTNASDVVDILSVAMESATFVDLSAMSFSNFANPNDQVVITGDDDAEYIIGSRVHDVVNGNGGADTLNGSGGVDEVHGGGGDDTVVIDLIDGQAAGEVYDGGADTDTLKIINTGTSASYTQDLSDDTLIAIERLQFADPGYTSTAKVQLLASQIGGGLSAKAQVVGIAYADVTDTLVLTMGGATGLNLSGFTFVNFAGPSDSVTVIGDGDAETIIGSGVRDLIRAGGGADILEGGLGGDLLDGGDGIDTISYASARSGVTADIDQSGNNTGEAAGDSYVDVENLLGSAFGDILRGAAENNRIEGGAGNDTLDGRGGDDVLVGGSGNDTYVIDIGIDRVIEASNGGTDTVRASVSFSLAGQHVENLTLTGTSAVDATGNSLANVLTGNAGANRLNGGTGADRMAGGGGSDTYVVDNAGDRVVEGSNAGMDTVEASVSFSLAGQHIETLILTGTGTIGGTGNSLANRLAGNGKANRLDGGAGADILTGGAGSDSFAFTAALGSGVDRITDFSPSASGNDDTILLSGTVFGLSKGALKTTAFKDVGAAGATLDASDRIVYDRRTGFLAYDADGSGAGAAVRFAILDNKAILMAADFTVA